MSWESVVLGDVTDTLKGFAFKSTNYSKSGIKIVRVSNFTSDSISDIDIIHYPEDSIDEYHKYLLKIGDVLIQTVGSWPNNAASVVGKVVKVPKNLDGSLLNQNIVKIYPKSNQTLDNKFLYYCLKSDRFQDYNVGNAVGAANQASITLESIKTYCFNLPPLPIQRRIADILSAYDDLIENNQRQIKLLEEAAMRLYREWFVFMRFPGHESVRIVDGVPEGWERVSVESVLDKIPTTIEIPTSEILTDGKIPVIDQSNAYIAGYTDKEEAKIVYDVPIIIFGDHTRILKLANFPFAQGADGTKLIISKNPSMPQHLFYYSLINLNLSSHHYARHFKYLKESLIIQPTLEVALMFEKIVSLHHEEITKLRVMNRSLMLTRDALLPRLMNGGVGLKLEGGAV